MYLLAGGVFLTVVALPAFTAGPKGHAIGQGNIHGRGILPLVDGGVNSSGIAVGSHSGQINIGGEMTNQGISTVGTKLCNIGTLKGYVVMGSGNDMLLGRPSSNVVLKINSHQDSTAANAAKVNSSAGNELTLSAGDVFSQAIVKNHYASSPAEGDIWSFTTIGGPPPQPPRPP